MQPVPTQECTSRLGSGTSWGWLLGALQPLPHPCISLERRGPEEMNVSLHSLYPIRSNLKKSRMRLSCERSSSGCASSCTWEAPLGQAGSQQEATMRG